MMAGVIIITSNTPTKPFVYSMAMTPMEMATLIGSILIGQVINVPHYKVFQRVTVEDA